MDEAVSRLKYSSAPYVRGQQQQAQEIPFTSIIGIESIPTDQACQHLQLQIGT